MLSEVNEIQIEISSTKVQRGVHIIFEPLARERKKDVPLITNPLTRMHRVN